MKTINKWLFSLIGLYICSTILFSADQSLFRIVEYFIPNWIYAPIIYRLYFVLLITSSLLILFRKSKKIVILHIALLILPIIDTFLFIFGYKDYNLLFSHTQNIYEITTLSILTIISSAFIIRQLKHIKVKKSKKYIFPLVVIIAIATSFIKPVYIDDWIAPEVVSKEKNEMISELNDEFNINQNENAVYAFFTTTCPFCKMAALKLGINERNGKLPKTYIFFPSKKEDAEAFLKSNRLKNIQYFLVEDKTFLKYAGNSFPSIYFSSNEKTYHWTGSKFNYRALNLISEK